MIVIFGASTDVGRRLATKLTDAKLHFRMVSRSGSSDIEADLSTGVGMQEAMQGVDTVVSCAHSKFTDQILAAVPSSVSKVILTGSAWRYSKVPDQRADQVRNAEASFLKSNRSGVMLHPTMIYGGEQENNIKRLLQVIRQLPLIPAPGGGNQIVQPIYIDDVVDCLFAALTRDWRGTHVVALAGPPLTWRDMVESCAASIDCPKPIIGVPASPIIAILAILNMIGLKHVDANMVRRFRENVNISVPEMVRSLSVPPRDFDRGVRQAVADWKRGGSL